MLMSAAGVWAVTTSLIGPSAAASGGRIIPAAGDTAAVLAAFGPPESDRITDPESLNRGVGMRLFTYASRHVRVVFTARTAGFPPRRVWKLAGVLDPDTKHMLEGVEAVKRLKARH
jgi:hypothetical protein